MHSKLKNFSKPKASWCPLRNFEPTWSRTFPMKNPMHRSLFYIKRKIEPFSFSSSSRSFWKRKSWWQMIRLRSIVRREFNLERKWSISFKKSKSQHSSLRKFSLKRKSIQRSLKTESTRCSTLFLSCTSSWEGTRHRKNFIFRNVSESLTNSCRTS